MYRVLTSFFKESRAFKLPLVWQLERISITNLQQKMMQ